MKHSNLDLIARRYTNLVVFRRENHTDGLIGLLKGDFWRILHIASQGGAYVILIPRVTVSLRNELKLLALTSPPLRPSGSFPSISEVQNRPSFAEYLDFSDYQYL